MIIDNVYLCAITNCVSARSWLVDLLFTKWIILFCLVRLEFMNVCMMKRMDVRSVHVSYSQTMTQSAWLWMCGCLTIFRHLCDCMHVWICVHVSLNYCMTASIWDCFTMTLSLWLLVCLRLWLSLSKWVSVSLRICVKEWWFDRLWLCAPETVSLWKYVRVRCRRKQCHCLSGCNTQR